MYPIKQESVEWQSGKAKNITFIVTKDCQLACKYCYLVGKNDKERMSWGTAKEAIDYILGHETDFPEESVVWEFIGGEPFLEIELIDRICDYLKVEMFRHGHHWFDSYRFSFSTNGINYHSEKVQQFIEKNHTHLSIGITIDGTHAKHDLNRIYKGNGPIEKGSYNDVVRNIPLWLEQFPGGGTKVTISSPDIPYICESVLHLYSLGIHEVNINCVFEDVWKDGDDRLYENQLIQLADAIIDGEYYKDYACSFFSEIIGKPLDPKLHNENWCGAGKMLAVDASGNFYPCTRFAAYSLREKHPIIIGNVYDGIDKNKLRPFLTLDRLTQSPRKCIECEIASGCAWCQGENYDAADTSTIYQRSTAICLMHKARVRANNYYWNKLYRKLELEGEREQFENNRPKLNDIIC
ncbi:MAG: radical SAM peptide maturase, CXXX-repeat target family [Muribaculaceae bacterium]|nr:radical SAM peptide maturase, CXXX-repeat target family [Muribaculaceae bacterium]